MRIIPVVDLQAGHVVHGIAGQRDAYRPIQSRLTNSSAPADIAAALRSIHPFPEIYVADLDALAGQPLASHEYACIATAEFDLLIDAGINSIQRLEQWQQTAAHLSRSARPVLALEAIESFKVLTALSERLDLSKAVFSLDLFEGRCWTSSPEWHEYAPIDLVRCVAELGFGGLIVLDLADVGRSGGTSTLDLCRQARDQHAQLEIIAGGGVRGIDDLVQLRAAGCDGALVASALHSGVIGRSDIELLANEF